MAQPVQRWPRWKIGLTAAICICAAIALFTAGIALEPDAANQKDGETPPLISVPIFLTMIGALASMLGVLSVGWYIYRVRLDRKPPWERQTKRKRRRRR